MLPSRFWPTYFWPTNYWQDQYLTWLLIPDYITWRGLWSATSSYEVDEAVLYQDGDLIHAFVSKTGHNIDHTPTTEYIHWTRLIQENWS